MLSIGMVSLIVAFASGVYGFTADAPPTWAWGKSLFIVFLVPAAAAFVASTLKRPSLLWEVIDDIHGARVARLRVNASGSRVSRNADGAHVSSAAAVQTDKE